MKLKSFRIWNYKSIIDSGECRLSDNDNVLVLAGQNESGKSAVLQALYDYESAELREDCERRLDGDSFEYPIIKCTYIIEESDDLINEVDAKNQALTDRIVEAIKPLKEITIIRKFKSQDEFILSFDNEFGVLLRNVVGETQAKTERVIENDTEAETEKETDSNQIDMERLENDIADQIFQVTPKIIFFDDFCDLLPDKILISDLVNKNKDAKGYSAVKNVEKILGTNFADYQKLSDAVRASRQDVHTRRLTADFNQRWTQKIFEDNQVTIDVDYNQGGAEGQAYLNFCNTSLKCHGFLEEAWGCFRFECIFLKLLLLLK